MNDFSLETFVINLKEKYAKEIYGLKIKSHKNEHNLLWKAPTELGEIIITDFLLNFYC